MHNKQPTSGKLASQPLWNFDNSYARLNNELFEPATPEEVPNPSVVFWNQELATALGLGKVDGSAPETAAMFSGNLPPEGSTPIAQAYAGHQYGNLTMLGDGRAILAGEHLTPEGTRWDVQWKGTGRTTFSRRGDGKAALGPMLREAIIGEAMHAFGIPTTRALAVVRTGEPVFREKDLPGAVLTRIASSHIRVGTFEYAARIGKPDVLRQLTDYTIQRHYPECAEAPNPALQFLREVIKRQAHLVAAWMQVGFVHGVMNTDNVSICGETIDFGPCAFLDAYSPDAVFSSIDRNGRYAFGNQPNIAAWNLTRFAECLLDLLSPDNAKAIELATGELRRFSEVFSAEWKRRFFAKLGLTPRPGESPAIAEEFLAILQETEADFTNSFLALHPERPAPDHLLKNPAFPTWHANWRKRVAAEECTIEEIEHRMRRANPSVIPRNHKVEQALEEATNGLGTQKFQNLIEIVRTPFSPKEEVSEYQKPAPPSAIPYKTFCGT